jgi:hypothetical protein
VKGWNSTTRSTRAISRAKKTVLKISIPSLLEPPFDLRFLPEPRA